MQDNHAKPSTPIVKEGNTDTVSNNRQNAMESILQEELDNFIDKRYTLI